MMAVRLDQVLENNRKDIEKYVCPCCDYLLRDAVQTSCGHWLCECCAIKELAKEVSPLCPRPDCQKPWDGQEKYFPDRFVRKQLEKCSVKCCCTGCAWVGDLGLLSKHFAECRYTKTQCLRCKEWFSADEKDSHKGSCVHMGDMKQCCFSELGCHRTHKMTNEELRDHISNNVNLVEHLEIVAKHLQQLKPVSASNGPFSSGDVSHKNVSMTTPSVTESYLKPFLGIAEIEQRYSESMCGSEVGFLHDLVPQSKQVADMLQQFMESKREAESLKKLLILKDAEVTRLQSKVSQLEKAIQPKSSEGEDRDFRLSLIKNINYDGTMIWKIPQFSQHMEDARSGKYTSIFSLPFYSSRNGYKMCLRLYILGDGIGKNTHMSLFFVVMKGEFDAILQWPFTHKVSFRLINQHHGRDIVDVFQPDPLSSSFQQPKTDMNVASGCPRFVSLDELEGFIIEDTIWIMTKVDLSTTCV